MFRNMPRIILFHATPVAMDPIRTAMAALWPAAEAVNLLDDGLTTDRAKEGAQMSEQLIERFVDLGRYAKRIGADGILVTCSAFGPAVDRMAVELNIPVLKPNEAMFRAAIGVGDRIGMLATFAPAVPTMEDEFRKFVGEAGSTASVETILVPEAMEALRKGEVAKHNGLVAAMAHKFANQDAVMLAHFSTSHAAQEVSGVLERPVFTAPESAVTLMKKLVTG
ncbi:aspartate/glutamate racemase family protein [Phyllobacterium sp. SB3]|uniref:aspartate/glutamate racemase family protein n=1 Tax=Phyllobacterium sp. SB3 TaxID=3156073 RepID=UPI0032AF9D0F